ncbi:MAG: DUF1415 domain-containing protein [Bdellovibrionales bacterium]|nr:DUF1415 domain-containing protein [Bdellovibrionales bacterium]
MNDHLSIVGEMQTWLEKSVIGLNLCPFAKAVHLKKQIRYHVSSASTGEELLRDLISELQLLENTDPIEIDTVLLIHPDVLSDFLDYNDFLEVADAALLELGLEGIFQIASFHPQYQFAGSSVDDISNYTNRSPYPALHILREASVTKAVDSYPDVEGIPERNIQTLKGLGLDGWNRLGVGRR